MTDATEAMGRIDPDRDVPARDGVSGTGGNSRLKDFAEAISLPIVFKLVGATVALTGLGHYGSFFGMVAAIALATWYMRRRGETWAGLGFTRPKKLWLTAILVPVTAVVGYGAAVLAAMFIAPQLGIANTGHDAEFFQSGDLVGFLTFMIVMAWASASFGEELTARGFMMRRFETAYGGGLFGIGLAITTQALIFGAGHAALGGMGVLTAGTIGLVFGVMYYIGKRNLWHLILAHGLIDTFSLTMLFLGAGVH